MTLTQLVSVCLFFFVFVSAFPVEQQPSRDWETIRPGGDTMCSRGTPFAFFVRRGDPRKLVIELQGGGCCFSAVTCRLPQYLSSMDETATKIYLQNRGGIGNHGDTRNPVQTWTHVYVPYCTGDGHMGNKTADYGFGFKFQHKGKVNAHSALAWAGKNIPNPMITLTTGTSAGAVGTYTLAPFVMQMYPAARNFHLADSYAPVFGKKGYNDGLKNWNSAAAYLESIPGLGYEHVAPWRPQIAAYGVNMSALAFPKSTWASYVSAHDSVQNIFYRDEGCGADCNWPKAMRKAMAEVHEHAPNFASFIGPGSVHGSIDSNFMYEQKSGSPQVILADWLRDMLSDKPFQQSVDCEPNC